MAEEIELLAPAGNRLSLIAAVQSGADAVYIGGQAFNARRAADNFTIEEIKECADYCHLYGVKLHVTVNTLIKEKELDALLDYARALNRANVDALIVQDLGAARLIHEMCPDMPLHASTQMTVTSLEGVRFLEDMGFSRVVLARELTKDEIEYIARGAKAEIEVFVHGALCMCYSGRCLMSSVIGGRSANRGRCAQPCRLPYSLVQGDTKSGGRENANGDTKPVYALSPKDLALINELDELKRIGVKSLKIEGRLKRPEYVSAVTGIYRKYLDHGGTVSREDMAELTSAFSRSGFTDGYFKGKTGAAMMSRKAPGNMSDNVFTDAAKSRARDGANVRKIPVSIYASLAENDVLRVIMTSGETSVTAEGTLKSEPAENRPLDADALKARLVKLGQTPFSAEEIYAEVADGITLPAREINEVRRNACAALIRGLAKRDAKRENPAPEWGHKTKGAPERVLLTAECETTEQALECLKAGVDILYVPKNVADAIGDTKCEIVTRLADIFDAEETDAQSVTVSSAAAARYYKGRRLYAGSGINAFNSVTADMFKDAELVTLSPELNLREARDAVKNTAAKCELIAYGRLTLMLMKNCPARAFGKCVHRRGGAALRDRKGEEFPILCSPGCTARLINSKPVFTADRISDILGVGADALRLIFTTEDAPLTKKIARLYRQALDGAAVKNPFAQNRFTRGHYYRGVE